MKFKVGDEFSYNNKHYPGRTFKIKKIDEVRKQTSNYKKKGDILYRVIECHVYDDGVKFKGKSYIPNEYRMKEKYLKDLVYRNVWKLIINTK